LAVLREEELHALAAGALVGLGLRRQDALDAARILVLGDLFGHHTHGVSRLESYGERLELGGIKPQPDIRIERVAATIATVDGDNGVGPLVGFRALEAAMAMARESGTGIAFARNSNHFGAVGPYNYLAAEAGFASIVGSNSTATIAPTGGSEARVGNSPLAFGLPSPRPSPKGEGEHHIILDMALSVVARAKIRDALKRGESIPDTWATDKGGRPTTDPKAALDGFLLPIGGYKGYGLALIVDLFAGVLSNAAYLTHVESWIDAPDKPQNLGHFFFVIDTRKLGSQAWLAERVQDFAAIVHDTPRVDPARPVLLPGEIEMNNLERQRREGIAIDAALREKLAQFAARA
jgi:LDH2 family malate/lactate/ureidoglycolate dehydrogenase